MKSIPTLLTRRYSGHPGTRADGPLLRREWEQVREQALVLKEMADGSARRRSDPTTAIQQLLLGFLDRLSRVTVLDPACGSGNFLYLSMNLLKEREYEVITFTGGRLSTALH